MKKIIMSAVILLGIAALLASCTANANGNESESGGIVKQAETMIKDVVDGARGVVDGARDIVDGARERFEDMSEWATHDGDDYIIGKDHHGHRPIDRSRLFPNGK